MFKKLKTGTTKKSINCFENGRKFLKKDVIRINVPKNLEKLILKPANK